jgi:ribosome-associated translation inhibitor RaiA
VEIIFHAHHAVISNGMQQRAERTIRRLAQRLGRPVDAIVRFEQDGPTRRLEIVLHAPRRRALVAQGFSRTFGPALSEAVGRIEEQIRRRKRTAKQRTAQQRTNRRRVA